MYSYRSATAIRRTLKITQKKQSKPTDLRRTSGGSFPTRGIGLHWLLFSRASLSVQVESILATWFINYKGWRPEKCGAPKDETQDMDLLERPPVPTN